MSTESRSAVLYRQKDFPVMQNRLHASRDEALSCPRGDIELVQDAQTGIVCNAAFDETLVQYDREYQNDQSLSPAFQQHLRQVLELLRRHFGNAPVIEMGCGKATFLEMMREAGMDAMGVDPAYEGNADYVIRTRFTPQTSIRHGHIVLRHVLEHVRDPLGFLHAIRDAAGGKGLIYIEVPCLDWIINNRAWYDIYYEHVNYFRLDDFHRMFGRVIDAGHLFRDQYLYVVADLSTLKETPDMPAERVSLPEDFLTSISSENRSQPNDKKGWQLVWRAASKGVIFCLLKIRAGEHMDFCIDINPKKQGRYLPATGLKVLSPEEARKYFGPETTIHVANPNYLDEIIELSGNTCQYRVIGQ